jgi:hypothetical protein
MLKIIHQSENKARKTRDLTILGLTKVSLPMDAGKIKRMAVFWTEGDKDFQSDWHHDCVRECGCADLGHAIEKAGPASCQ